MESNKFVLNTNIWITYFLNNNFRDIATIIEIKGIELCRSFPSLSELTNVLNKNKFKNKFKAPLLDYINFYLATTTHYDTLPIFTACEDANDNFLFDLAIQSKTNYIVSGDKKVLTTPVVLPMQVITLSEFKSITNN
ncbi:MAG: putative toxin-antitoxin system toxin component, PIN family [Ignavibacteria bacterium]|jgi:putative PIN family toxin of toxin-antitoxin system|nr:putative toxin-antitoxin system toxin component, PIN family [Ignavibacteria bacterium]